MANANPVGQNIFTFKYNNAEQVLAIGTAIPAVCIFITGLRFITRALQNAKFGLDDWLSLGGLIAVLGMGACLIDGAVRNSLGYPTPEGPASLTSFEQLSYIDPRSILVLKLQFAFQLIMMLSNGFIKLSIVAFYRRIFVTRKNSVFDIVTKILASVIFLWTITYILIDVFACGGHVTANWGSLDEQSKYCDTIGYTSEEGFAVSDLIIDIFVIASPLPLVWKLHMKTIRKLGVTCVLLLGATAIAASIARLVIYLEVLHATEAGVDLDTNLCITAALWWSMLEAGLSLIAGSLPTLSYLINHSSLQSALGSVRSKLSLRSTKSTRGSEDRTAFGSKEKSPYAEIRANNSTASHTGILGSDDRESHELNEVSQGIYVKHEVTMTDDMV
ncbi:MAG: hypothetical protein ASARMPREDX12_007700 [Alectoria sarmentosa]|nr:MAG: hypothetical protein ASARMPREDX12_007700 [Alectoria sarmentosa]